MNNDINVYGVAEYSVASDYLYCLAYSVAFAYTSGVLGDSESP